MFQWFITEERAEHMETRSRFGPLEAFLSAFLFSFGGLILKRVPWNPIAINGGRNLIALVITFLYLRLSGHKLILNRWVLLGAVCMAGTTITFCAANKLTTAANAILLQYSSPAFVILLSLLLFRQRPKRRDVRMCIAVLLGIVCFFFDSLSAGRLAGNALALFSGVCYAVVFLSGKLPGGDPASAFFWGEVISALVGLPLILRESEFSAPVCLSVVALGVIVGSGYVLLSLALHSIPPVTANLIGTIEPVLNPTWVAIFAQEHMTPLSVVGFVIVLVSILVYNAAQLRKQKPGP